MSVASMGMKPLESMSWVFIDTKPGIIKYDVKHTQVVTIGQISKKMEAGQGTVLWSEVFSVKIGEKITDWRIAICPNGYLCPRDGLVSIGHIGIGLTCLDNLEFPIDATTIFSLINRTSSKRKGKKSDQQTFGCFAQRAGVGVADFISHLELREKPDLIPEDTITIVCELTIKDVGVSLVGSDSESKSRILVPAGNESKSIKKYMGDMEEVFKIGKFTDVTIVCQGREFPCHKAILAGRSPVFDAMFSPNFKEGTENKVDVVDVAADIFEELLRFIYSGKVGDCCLKDVAGDLLVAAEKYGVLDLKELCEEILCANTTVGNVLEMMELADLHNAAKLRAAALKFIGENAKEVSSQKEWRERIPDAIADIFDAIIHK